MSSYNFRVTVIGHVAIDVTTELDDVEFKIVEGKFSDYNRRVQNRMGGTGSVLAMAARELGCSTAIIGKVGADAFGQFIINELHNHNIVSLVTTDRSTATGTVIMVYLPNDQRILLADRGANAQLSPDDIDAAAEEQLCSSHLVIVSGYAFLDPKPRATVYQAMKIAQEAGGFVAFDVTPHTMYRILSFSDFIKYTTFANAITLELNTARRFLGREDKIDQPYDEAEISWVAEQLLEHYQLLILTPTNDEQLIITGPLPKDWRIQATGYSHANADKRACHDKVFVRTLCEYLAANNKV